MKKQSESHSVSSTLFLCTFWSISLEKGNENAELILKMNNNLQKKFSRLLKVVFDLRHKESMRKLGDGSMYAE